MFILNHKSFSKKYCMPTNNHSVSLNNIIFHDTQYSNQERRKECVIFYTKNNWLCPVSYSMYETNGTALTLSFYSDAPNWQPLSLLVICEHIRYSRLLY